MDRRYDYHQNDHYGWNTTSQEYVEHITRIARMPTIVTDVPCFLNPYKAFNGEEQHEDRHPRLNHQNHQVPEARKKVHFVEQERKATEVHKNEKTEVNKEFDVNTAADGFINQNRRNFAQYKWGTFK